MGRRLALTVLAVATVISAALAGAGAQSFIEGSEDLPLAPVLEAVDEAGMVFDSPSGRIVEAFATGDTDRQEVLAFYAETLPSLGWEQLAEGRYRREGERLAIDFFGSDGALSVRFTLAPE